MSSKENFIISYVFDKSKKTWTENFTDIMAEANSSDEGFEEFDVEQKIYEKFSCVYDRAVLSENYSGPEKVAVKMETLFATDKEIEILDIGCGTGLVADSLSKRGFKNITGFDSNIGLMEKAKEKNVMKNYVIGRGKDGLKLFPDNHFDVACSSAVFFVSKGHPGTECFEEIFRILKPGGIFLLLIKNTYLSYPHVDWSVVRELEERKVMKFESKDLLPGYRKYYEGEEDKDSLAVILIYRAL